MHCSKEYLEDMVLQSYREFRLVFTDEGHSRVEQRQERGHGRDERHPLLSFLVPDQGMYNFTFTLIAAVSTYIHCTCYS